MGLRITRTFGRQWEITFFHNTRRLNIKENCNVKKCECNFFSLYLSSATLRQSFIRSECKRRYRFYILVHRILPVRLSGQLFLDHLGHPARTNKLIRRYAKNNQTRPTNRHKARYVDLMAHYTCITTQKIWTIKWIGKRIHRYIDSEVGSNRDSQLERSKTTG